MEKIHTTEWPFWCIDALRDAFWDRCCHLSAYTPETRPYLPVGSAVLADALTHMKLILSCREEVECSFLCRHAHVNVQKRWISRVIAWLASILKTWFLGQGLSLA